MKYLKEFENEADVNMTVLPNVVYVSGTRKVIYNYFPKGVFIQHINGSIYTAEQWTAKEFSNESANGVAVIAEEAKFVIAKNYLPDTYQWSNNRVMVEGVLETRTQATAVTDFNGRENTSLIIDASTSGAAHAAANYVFPSNQIGYLPAAGELNLLAQNAKKINEALTLIGGEDMSLQCWTSTQYQSSRAWYVIPSSGYTFTDSGKENSKYVRPFTELEIV